MERIRKLLSSSAVALFAFSAVDVVGAIAAEPTASTPARVEVKVGSAGYTPAEIEARAGVPLALVFERTTATGCGQRVVFPDHAIRLELPVGEKVEVVLTPKQDERIAFTCGMGMYRGAIVAVR